MYKETAPEEVQLLLANAAEAFQWIKKKSHKERAGLMYAIADSIEKSGPELISVAMKESHLPQGRLTGEKARTVFQWRSYADWLLSGNCFDARIDTAIPDKTPPKPDLRKTKIGLGPVVVFGASNFPFAFSTAGGDTASAIAAGCPVVVKAHPAHPETSALMAEKIRDAVQRMGWHEGTFAHVYGDIEAGARLVVDPVVKSVAFTGSFAGGKALVDLASKRENPIPVFAEMGSVNPVFALPKKLAGGIKAFAESYVASLTLGVGQFCTNPGLLIVLKSAECEVLQEALAEAVSASVPATMLHNGIAEAFEANTGKMLGLPGVEIIAKAHAQVEEGSGAARIARVQARHFLSDKRLANEVFGPFGMLVICENAAEMLRVAADLEGQLTITLAATEEELDGAADLVDLLKDKCGRLLFNGMPTGVEVCSGMQHGGPFPATSDARFTSVGPDAIQRFLRPLSYQNWPDALLPDELKNANPLRIHRTVNNVWSTNAI